mmetsp:Transcript_35266/g.81664  ORF Transcript_35266/g.81664 Transcript_35266/m.81664 type:complete len:201 (+) Transcript_35266:1071-1673(+)
MDMNAHGRESEGNLQHEAARARDGFGGRGTGDLVQDPSAFRRLGVHDVVLTRAEGPPPVPPSVRPGPRAILLEDALSGVPDGRRGVGVPTGRRHGREEAPEGHDGVSVRGNFACGGVACGGVGDFVGGGGREIRRQKEEEEEQGLKPGEALGGGHPGAEGYGPLVVGSWEKARTGEEERRKRINTLGNFLKFKSNGVCIF